MDTNSNAHKKLYEAQKAEHEKTHAKLREEQKINRVLRGEIMVLERQINDAVDMLQGIANNINQAYPKRKK